MFTYKPTLLALLLVSVMGSFTSHATAAPKASAVFAGGCFWCMQPAFDKVHGVLDTIVGYTGGTTTNPTYEQIGTGTTGHYEAIKVIYDPEKVTFQGLLKIFWHNIDPLDAQGQFCDKGSTYRSAIFYANQTEKKEAEASKEKVEERFKQPVATMIIKANEFWPAEDYHQNYYLTNPIRYKFYRYRCGRDARLMELWGIDYTH
ncbi:peptide-methionine (S)-S-oxide reductase MsrA [Halodesulfovibrio marinisediminis]|uniref:Peptide methionine sulfoxide reductase MsrA n=1 Tax=Halodesulfovibrio marinisediminis DSM 17456 TaxID=1121457 RepID=A0A1N6IF30_9BACT|nr:peptide-methionine (S)-S-oxide reductase MsrA [Halodesulfovibrio marinisediminis]SIO30637.1 peptide-methionine (S)-S-oxide reductase [Halodesulfovibrio marinisediminis DSM 17456]